MSAEPTDAFPKIISTAVREATSQFFKSSCNLNFVDKPAAPDHLVTSGIMSNISFLGNPSWAFALVVPNAFAVTIAKAFAGYDIPFDSADMGDVFGEVVNVIAGDISARLDRKGMKAQMSLPTVIRGDHIDLHVPAEVSTSLLSFSGPAGSCTIKLIEVRGNMVIGRRPGA